MPSAPQELQAIVRTNTAVPLQLSALFAPFLPLAALDPSQHAQRTLTACGGPVAVPAAAKAAAAAAAGAGAAAAAAPLPPPPAGPDSAAAGPAAGGAGPDLAPFGEEVERLRAAAREVWDVAANDVRTGAH
jgi:hypothetical protein